MAEADDAIDRWIKVRQHLMVEDNHAVTMAKSHWEILESQVDANMKHLDYVKKLREIQRAERAYLLEQRLQAQQRRKIRKENKAIHLLSMWSELAHLSNGNLSRFWQSARVLLVWLFQNGASPEPGVASQINSAIRKQSRSTGDGLAVHSLLLALSNAQSPSPGDA